MCRFYQKLILFSRRDLSIIDFVIWGGVPEKSSLTDSSGWNTSSVPCCLPHPGAICCLEPRRQTASLSVSKSQFTILWLFLISKGQTHNTLRSETLWTSAQCQPGFRWWPRLCVCAQAWACRCSSVVQLWPDMHTVLNPSLQTTNRTAATITTSLTSDGVQAVCEMDVKQEWICVYIWTCLCDILCILEYPQICKPKTESWVSSVPITSDEGRSAFTPVVEVSFGVSSICFFFLWLSLAQGGVQCDSRYRKKSDIMRWFIFCYCDKTCCPVTLWGGKKWFQFILPGHGSSQREVRRGLRQKQKHRPWRSAAYWLSLYFVSCFVLS